jgi:hypothetical protein
MTLDEIVGHYIAHYRDAARSEMRFYETQRSASAAIYKAASCILPSSKRHPHQRRIPKAVLEQVEARLQAAGRKLGEASDFAALHGLVEQEIGGIRGVGKLTVYDISHRLGAYFRKAPELVYLHAGTRIGAAVFGLKGDFVSPKSLPAAFSRLCAAEIEDCLCIYKDDLLGAPRVKRTTRCGAVDRGGCYIGGKRAVGCKISRR